MKNRKFLIIIFLMTFFLSMVFISGCKKNISAIPTTFLLGTNGEVLGGNIGPLTEDQLIKAIEGAK